ncbi:MAG: hypothetical protein Q4B26_16265 [Eubacteriales bacterium]|nr:hypothetical protein [Eubacteriales bacterium]
MTSILQGAIDGDSFIKALIILFLVGYFLYKEWPELKKRVSKGSVDEVRQENEESKLIEDIAGIKKDIADLKSDIQLIKDRQTRDYNRMNELESETKRQRKAISESLSERKLLMRGIMACLDGLEQQGCNHTVPSTKNEINQYLNDLAHMNEDTE